MKITFSYPLYRSYLTKGLLLAFLAFLFSCSRKGNSNSIKENSKSAENSITSFVFTKTDNPALSADAAGTIDEANKTIAVELTDKTDLSSLKPTLAVSGKAAVSPASGAAQDFTKAVTYTVTAENGATKIYNVSVAVVAFISTWQVTADDLSLTLPLVDNGNYNFVINWGDGTPKQTVITKADGKHTYTAAGTYTTTITGTIEGFAFDISNNGIVNPEAKKIRTIYNWGPLKLGATKAQFAGAENLSITATDSKDLLSKTTDLSTAFYKATNFNSDISGWDVSQVTKMRGMFSGATAFNQPIGNWNVSQVTDMEAMFYEAAAFNQDIGKWDVSQVTNMTTMFYGATNFNKPIGSWKLSPNLKELRSMFQNAESFNQPLATSEDKTSWNVSRVEFMAEMFSGATAFNQDIGNWDLSNAVVMGYMFYRATAFNQDLSRWKPNNGNSRYGVPPGPIPEPREFATGSGIANDKTKWPQFKK